MACLAVCGGIYFNRKFWNVTVICDGLYLNCGVRGAQEGVKARRLAVPDADLVGTRVQSRAKLQRRGTRCQ